MLCLQSPPPGPPPYAFIWNNSQLLCFGVQEYIYSLFINAEGSLLSVCMCVCSNVFFETTGPIEAKFHVEPPWDRGRKFIQLVQVICCSSLLSTSGGGGGGGGLLAGILP